MTKLKQVIIVATDTPNDHSRAIALAKAPLSLVTRCFKGGKNFMGRHEATEYEKTIVSWMEDNDMSTELLETSGEDAETYFWTAEMMGIPCNVVKVHDTTRCVVFGPYEETTLDEILYGVPVYTA